MSGGETGGMAAAAVVAVVVGLVFAAVCALVLRFIAKRAAKLDWSYGRTFLTALFPILIAQGATLVLASALGPAAMQSSGRPIHIGWELGLTAVWFVAQVLFVQARHAVSAGVALKIAGLTALIVFVLGLIVGFAVVVLAYALLALR